MRKMWTAIACLSAGGVLVLLGSDPGWALPPRNTTYLLCKCTCRATDAQGNHYYGSSNGIWYTTSHDACDVFPKCKVGGRTGIATNCLGTEKSLLPLSRGGGGTTLQP